jgi:hypothetical protein
MVLRRRHEQFVRLVEAAQFMQSQRSQRAAMRAREIGSQRATYFQATTMAPSFRRLKSFSLAAMQNPRERSVQH